MQIDWIAFALLTTLFTIIIILFFLIRRRSNHSSEPSLSAPTSEKLPTTEPSESRFPDAINPTPLYHAPAGSQEMLQKILSQISLQKSLWRNGGGVSAGSCSLAEIQQEERDRIVNEKVEEGMVLVSPRRARVNSGESGSFGEV